MLDIFHKSDLIFFFWAEHNIVYFSEVFSVISSLPLHGVFGRQPGIIPCSECYWDLADWKCTAIQKFQICFPLCFWGIFQTEDHVILGTPLYCLHFSSWLLNCMADPACRGQCHLHLPVLNTGGKSKILVSHSPVKSGLFLCFRSFW